MTIATIPPPSFGSRRLGWAIKHISPYRALNHAASRQAVAACLRPLLSTAWLKQHNHWEESIYMEVRLELQTMDLDAHDCPLLDVSCGSELSDMGLCVRQTHFQPTPVNVHRRRLASMYISWDALRGLMYES